MAVRHFSGVGDPNGVVFGNPGDFYQDETGGANSTLWEKQSGVGTSAGWVAVASGGGVAVQDEGSPVGTFGTLNFVGEGSIEAIDTGGGVAQIIVPGMASAVVDGAGLTASARNCTVVRNGVGDYTVTFTIAFGDIPGIGATIAEATPSFITTDSITTGGFNVKTFTGAGVAADRAWTFAAIEGVTIT